MERGCPGSMTLSQGFLYPEPQMGQNEPDILGKAAHAVCVALMRELGSKMVIL